MKEITFPDSSRINIFDSIPDVILPHGSMVPVLNGFSSEILQPILILDSNICNAIHSVVQNKKFTNFTFDQVQMFLKSGLMIEPSLYVIENSSKLNEKIFLKNCQRVLESVARFYLSMPLAKNGEVSIQNATDLELLFARHKPYKVKQQLKRFARWSKVQPLYIKMMYLMLLLTVNSRRTDPLESVRIFAKYHSEHNLPTSGIITLVAMLYFLKIDQSKLDALFGYNKTDRNDIGITKLYASAVDLYFLTSVAQTINQQTKEFSYPTAIVTKEKKLHTIFEHIELIYIKDGVPAFGFKDKTISANPKLEILFDEFRNLFEPPKGKFNLDESIRLLEEKLP